MEQIRFGFVADGFEQDNYISLFWGDENDQIDEDITNEEFLTIKEELKQRMVLMGIIK